MVSPDGLLHARLLAAAANLALEKRFGPATMPLLPNSGGASKLVEQLAAGAVPVEFAARAIEEQVETLAAVPRSLAYFAPGVVERWRVEQARRDAVALAPVSGEAERDPNYFIALRYAREGDPEWQQYCRERGIVWEAA